MRGGLAIIAIGVAALYGGISEGSLLFGVIGVVICGAGVAWSYLSLRADADARWGEDD